MEDVFSTLVNKGRLSPGTRHTHRYGWNIHSIQYATVKRTVHENGSFWRCLYQTLPHSTCNRLRHHQTLSPHSTTPTTPLPPERNHSNHNRNRKTVSNEPLLPTETHFTLDHPSGFCVSARKQGWLPFYPGQCLTLLRSKAPSVFICNYVTASEQCHARVCGWCSGETRIRRRWRFCCCRASWSCGNASGIL